jgi:cell division protease FtsH
MPTKNRLSYWKKEVLDKLVVLMGGRAAEEIFVQDMSSGAQHDIMQATKIARSMVCEWGMTDNLGTVTYDERSESGQYLGMSGYHEKSYSDETAQAIDKEVRSLIDVAHTRALEILKENKEKVQLMTDMLMEFETLDSLDIKEIMDGSWNSETKRGRVKTADELQIKAPPPLPTDVRPVVKPSEDPEAQGA